RFIIAAVLAFVFASGDAQANRTNNCSDEAQANIALAVRFINNNMDRLKNPPFSLGKRRGQRRRIHRKMDRKLGKLRYGCKAAVLCPVGDTKNGHAMWGIMGRKVRLCYDNMKHRGFQFCGLVRTVAHEFGHTVGIPKDPFAQHGKNRSDRVYQFGRFARELCEEAGLQRPLDALPRWTSWKKRY
ncbi:MAG: hypothetical protein KJO07_09655, partial [Deltaproteobacteria bacterium]|nr:hypothetical protein [Deltaproteobacteria bacterium]